MTNSELVKRANLMLKTHFVFLTDWDQSFIQKVVTQYNEKQWISDKQAKIIKNKLKQHNLHKSQKQNDDQIDMLNVLEQDLSNERIVKESHRQLKGSKLYSHRRASIKSLSSIVN